MASRHKPVVPDELLDRLLGGSDALEAFQSGALPPGASLRDSSWTEDIAGWHGFITRVPHKPGNGFPGFCKSAHTQSF